MNSPRLKRGQHFEGTDSSPNADKRARLELRLDGCEAPDTVPNENGHWDRDLELADLPVQWCATAELDFSSFAGDFDFSVLESLVPGSDVASAEYLPISVQPDVRQCDDGAIICYGALFEVQAVLLPSSTTVQGKAFVRDQEKLQQFKVVCHDNYHGLTSADSGMFARLDNVTSAALQCLRPFSNCHVTAVVESAILQRTTLAGRSKGIFPLSLNVFGAEDEGDIIGDRLADASAFLQHPCFLEDGYEYYNPQYFYPDNKKTYLTHLIGLSESEMRAKRLSDEVEGVLASLDETSFLTDDFVDDFVLDGIITPLKKHQKAALNFIRQHEDYYGCQSMAGDLRRLLGLSVADNVPCHAIGGILADVMGLGKTLSILSAIVSSRPTSVSYQDATASKIQGDMVFPTILKSRATLIVVTSIQVLDGWKREIATHLKEDALSYMVFHGDGRPKLPECVTEHDLVLTTYATLVADCKGSGVLQKIAWFRVVLDEAHWIRNQNSQQFRASVKLLAQRRWCLTGTPIQNRLDDLLSLLRFLHFEPFCRPSIFQKHVLAPLSQENSEGSKMLHVLLRGICLRRNEKYLELSEPHHQEIKLTLSTGEKTMYDEVLRRFQEDLDNLVSNQSKTKKYAILFTMVMKLRRLCNHGTMHMTEQLSLGAATEWDPDTFCDYCQGPQQDNLASLNKDQVCPECNKIISTSSQKSPESPWAESQAFSTNLPTWRDFVMDQTAGDTLPRPRPMIRKPSTKLAAVVENLKTEPPYSKSLVFSYWTSTLDLLQSLLTQNNIPSLRIDGRVSYEQRLRALETFRNDPDVTVLLMSIQTGSVGLNLAIANRVHIIEPQWNPSVEEQAIGRALRMGQTRTVTVIRYSMNKTVEENIRNMQRRKRNLAKFTLDGADGDSGTLEDLKFMLNLK